MECIWNTFSQDPLHVWTVMDCKGIILQLVHTLMDNATMVSCIGALSVTTYQMYSYKRKQEETLIKQTQKMFAELERKQKDALTEFTSNVQKLEVKQAESIEKEKSMLAELIETGQKTITELIGHGQNILTEHFETLAIEKAALEQSMKYDRKTLNVQAACMEKERKQSTEVIRHDKEMIFDQSAKMKQEKETFNEFKFKEKNALTELIGREKSTLTELIRQGEKTLTEQAEIKLKEQAAWMKTMRETFTESIRKEKDTLIDLSAHAKKEITASIENEKDTFIRYAERIEQVKDDWVKSVEQGTEKMSENTAKMRKQTETLINQTRRIEQVKDDWVELVIKENKLNEQTAQIEKEIKTLFSKSKRTEHDD
ncbi:uncharacterized protein LOC143081797 [Mytilus galloprovincialis]|uniref:uncharacterized protein LOC143081797 n=1 Tax=Mytilus galloprovincialis TaxID=29158 RepID=UPI003F7BD4A2